MDGAALLLVVSAVGVGFGWQPMPDGTPRYEYIVQIEPEVAATLADGKSIPIVSEPPEEIQPIGRVRVVVGRGDLPRQRLVTRLKPAETDAQTQSGGVALAQYQAYDQPRYGVQQPASSQPDPQRPTTEWNSGGADAPVTPTGNPAATSQQLFGGQPAGGSAWNSAEPRVATAPTTGPLARVGEGLQQATEPIRKGFDDVGNQLRAGSEKIGSRTRDLVDELKRPFNGQTGSTAPGDSRAPAVTGVGATPAPEWNATAPGSVAATGPGAGAAGSTTNWNGSPSTQTPAPTAVGSPSGRYGQTGVGVATPNAQASSQWNNGDAANAAGAAAQNGGLAPPPLTTSAANDPWAAAVDPRTNAKGAPAGGTPTGIPNVATAPESSYGGGGSTWPGTGMGVPIPELGGGTAGSSGLSQSPPAAVGNGNPAATAAGTPTIERNMLSEPASRPLDGTSASPLATVSNPTPEASAPPAKSQLFGGYPPSAAKGAEKVDAVNRTKTEASQGTSAPSRDNAALVLLAWVLLSGSIAGNGYLFWSYLDIRHKYRLMVRKSARAVGRYSPA